MAEVPVCIDPWGGGVGVRGAVGVGDLRLGARIEVRVGGSMVGEAGKRGGWVVSFSILFLFFSAEG